ncbi:MAG: hypothetical protein ACYDD2_15635 [Candidatus Acidiferrales bacterium]
MLCELGSHDSPNRSEYERPGTTAVYTVKVNRAEGCANASANNDPE